jgi:hypothetical protein
MVLNQELQSILDRLVTSPGSDITMAPATAVKLILYMDQRMLD